MYNKEKKVHFIHSVKFRILLLTFIIVLLAVTMNNKGVVSLSKEQLISMDKDYISDMSKVTCKMLNTTIDAAGPEKALSLPNLTNICAEMKVKGLDSSYTYVVAKDGTMLFHPTKDKIGKKVENAAITDVVNDLKAGKKVEDKVVSYKYHGEIKYASYRLTKNSEAIIVASADKSDIVEPIQHIITRVLMETGVIVIVLLVVFFFFLQKFLNPFTKMVAVVGRVANLDITPDEVTNKYKNKKDEVGVMSRELIVMKDKLKDIIHTINEQSDDVSSTVTNILQNTEKTTTNISQVDSAVGDIAVGAGNQAEETQKATEKVIVIGDMINKTNDEVAALSTNSEVMRKSEVQAFEVLNELNKITDDVKKAIDDISKQINTTNESAQKIREVITLITSIAEETNLLSLNASIEAARAGEQGRGFAVVASQIQTLAEQSNSSANQIEDIIKDLIKDSDIAVNTMNEVKVIIDKQNKNIDNTHKMFSQVKIGIDQSISSVNQIKETTGVMDNAKNEVVEIVQNLAAISEENAASSQETSASVTLVAEIMGDLSNKATELQSVSEKLTELIKSFKM